MLTIKRVPTIVSNHEDSRGYCDSCLNICCLPGSSFPLYQFKKVQFPGNEVVLAGDSIISFLRTLLFAKWDDCMRKGLFRYDVTACQSKIIPGEYGFIAQLNEGRHAKKRPTEFRVDQVLQPFDHKKFNFTKIGQEEILFMFQESNDDKSHYSPNASASTDDSPNFIAINVSPIEYGHVLLIPRLLDCLQQKMDKQSFLLALHMAVSAADPFFRVGYNSLGAFATINHLHFQAYYLEICLPIEKSPAQLLISAEGMSRRGVRICQVLNYPVRGFLFEGAITLEHMAVAVSTVCCCLQENNVPFNVLISNIGKQVFLLPQCYAEKQACEKVNQELLETQVNPAVWELGGHMVMKRRQDYAAVTEAFACRLLSEASLSEQRFEEVKSLVMEGLGLDKIREDSCSIEKDVHHLPVRPELTSYAVGCLVLQ